MRRIAVLTLALVFASTLAIAQSVGLGFSYLNLSTNGERLSPIVTQDVSLQLAHEDAFIEYGGQFHQDEVWRQTLNAGLRWKNFYPFYNLSCFQGAKYSGGGIMLVQNRGQGNVSLTGIYREQGYGFSAKCTADKGPVTGSIGYAYDKYGEWIVQGPSVQIGVRW